MKNTPKILLQSRKHAFTHSAWYGVWVILAVFTTLFFSLPMGKVSLGFAENTSQPSAPIYAERSAFEALPLSARFPSITDGTLLNRVLRTDESLKADTAVLQEQAGKEHIWQTNNVGIEHLVLGTAANPFILVRINPAVYEFVLCMASEKGESLSFKDWALEHNLHVAINASMYLPDEKTSTGYMQSATHSNNERIGSRLGAFFVAEPFDLENSPRVAIIEKGDSEWEKRIQEYRIRVQNFRLLGRDGTVPWKKNKKPGSIAAIGQEDNGNIVFMVSVLPLTVPEFARIARLLVPRLANAMYVEGSVKVGMYLHDGEEAHIWQGRKNIVYTPAPQDTRIPNIIGVVPRER